MATEVKTISQLTESALAILRKERQEGTTTRACGIDIEDPEVYKEHSKLLTYCADTLLAPQFRKFDVDESNRDVLRFLLYYFNGSRMAEDVYPDKGYKLHKNILLCGEAGVGKTLIMQAFSKYLEVTGNIRAFKNVSVTQMINYYKINNTIDRYTFNEEGSKNFDGNPVNVCLNDIGLQTHNFFGVDTKQIVCEFMYARNDIWQQQGKFAHLTTNLTPKDLKDYFADGFGRLNDRFKSYNIIHLEGKSRR